RLAKEVPERRAVTKDATQIRRGWITSVSGVEGRDEPGLHHVPGHQRALTEPADAHRPARLRLVDAQVRRTFRRPDGTAVVAEIRAEQVRVVRQLLPRPAVA